MLQFSMETGVMNTDNKMCNISLTSSMEDYLEAVLVLQQKTRLYPVCGCSRVFRRDEAFCEPGGQGTV